MLITVGAMTDDWYLPETYIWNNRLIRYGTRGSGTPIVVMHGTPWSSYNMRHLIHSLSNIGTVHFYDLLGYGSSDMRPGDVSLGVQNQILCDLVRHWGISNPILIGHDLGGATALRAITINGLHVDRLVLIDPVAMSPWGSPFFRHVREYEDAFAGVPDYIHEAIVTEYVKTAMYTPLDQDVLKRTVKPWLGSDGKASFYRQIAQADSRFTDVAQERYSTIDRPVLILWGEQDTWIPVQRGEELERLIPNAHLVKIPGAGHLVIEERPDELVSQIKMFLASM